jgi:putative ABC transport system permease protein
MPQDLREAFRSLRVHRGLTFLTLSILVVAFTAAGLVIGLVNDVLLRPFPFPHADRLEMVWDTHRREPQAFEMTSLSNYLDYQSRNRVFEAMAAWRRPASMTLTGGGVAEELTGGVVTTTFFSVLGTRPAIGRDFRLEDGEPGSSPVAILSHGLWQRRFGASPDILDATMLLDDVSHRVIGVAPAELESPAGPIDLWVPMVANPNPIDRGQNYLRVLARRKAEVSHDEAQSEMEVLGAALGREYPATNRDWTPRLVPLSDQVVGTARPVLLSLLGAAFFLLLVATANVSNLQLVKAAAGEGDSAVRLSLGASRGRLFRRAMMENGTVAFGAAAASVAAIQACFPVLSAAVGPMLPRALDTGVDGITVAATVALGLSTSLLFSLPAAFYASRLPVDTVLRRGRATAPASRMRRSLVVVQIGLAFALLVGSGLVARSLILLGRVPLGFEPENVLVLRLALGDPYEEEARRVSYFEALLARLEALPPVRSAGAATVVPMSSFGIDFDVPYYIPGEPQPERADAPKARFRSATPGTFETLGTALLEGRDFTWRDDGNRPLVVIVNRTLARRIWGEGRALGKELRFFWADWRSYEVVGVVEDARSYRIGREPQPELFVPYSQYPYLVMNVVLESASDPEALASAARDAVLSLDPNQPVNGTHSMKALVAASTARETLAASLIGVVAAAALLLALLGIYGILSFSIRRKKREIGIRTALGAEPRANLKWALAEGAGSTLSGITFGLLLSFLTTERLSDLLFGVGARDPYTFAAASIFVFAASMLASYLAVRPALATDPATAIRADS